MRVAIVENTEVTHHGQVGVALHERAAVIDLYKPWRDEVLPNPGSFDALVVLGGEQSAVDDATHAYLPALAALMAQGSAEGTATLGICLGAQILARGLGAVNHLGKAPEFGWCEVSKLAAAHTDPVLRALPERFASFQWHSDTFTAPPGALHLMTSAAAPVQCFRTGRAGYGMQFHFEASLAVVRDWCARFRPIIDLTAPGWAEALEDDAALQAEAADRHGLQIARAWIDQIAR
jgi:GMP synthase (glutamine-hydrolysing)